MTGMNLFKALAKVRQNSGKLLILVWTAMNLVEALASFNLQN